MPQLQARFVPALRSVTPPPSESPATPPATTSIKPKRTAEQQALLDGMAKEHGKEYVEKNAALIIAQAEMIGNL